MSAIVCPVCSATRVTPYAVKNGCSMHKCGQCGLIFMSPMPDDSLDIYKADYFAGATEGFGYSDYDRDKEPMIPTFQTYLKIMDRHARKQPDRSMLDVGAATGFFLSLARDAGWQVHGIEPGDSAAAKARAKGLDVRTGILDAQTFPPQSFDAVTLWDVLEHLPDPVSTMQTVAGLLPPGGLAAINTPDVSSLYARMLGPRWHLLCPPEHLCLFGSKSLQAILERTGFRILQQGCIGKRFTLRYIAQTLAHWQPSGLTEAAAGFFQKRRVGEIAVPLNLFDNVFVLAQKT